jgi:hypothetical protein
VTCTKTGPKNDPFFNCRRKTKELSKKELSNVAPASQFLACSYCTHICRREGSGGNYLGQQFLFSLTTSPVQIEGEKRELEKERKIERKMEKKRKDKERKRKKDGKEKTKKEKERKKGRRKKDGNKREEEIKERKK